MIPKKTLNQYVVGDTIKKYEAIWNQNKNEDNEIRTYNIKIIKHEKP